MTLTIIYGNWKPKYSSLFCYSRIYLFKFRLDHLNELQQELIKTASLNPNHIIRISSSFALSKQQQQNLSAFIRAKINNRAKVRFHIARDFNFGIKLHDHGYTIFSDLDSCITQLEEKAEIQTAKGQLNQKQLVKT